jgi:hypothetical protein
MRSELENLRVYRLRDRLNKRLQIFGREDGQEQRSDLA